MPGPRDNSEHAPLRGCPSSRGLAPRAQGPELTTADVEDLCAAVDFSHCARIADMFGTSTPPVVTTLARHQLPVLSNSLPAADASVTHLDALQPFSYYRISQSGPIQAIIIDPPTAALDLALPLAAQHAQMVACVRVPYSYVSLPSAALQAWMQPLRDSGLLLTLTGPPSGPSARRSVWLIIFHSTIIRDALLRAPSEESAVALAP